MPTETEWASALDALRRSQRPLLVCHVTPDGDALGSMLAFALALTRVGRTFQASFPGPFTLPGQLDGMPGLHLLTPSGDVDPSPDLIVTFDAGSVDRLGEFGEFISSVRTVVIDHHPSNTYFGNVHLVDDSAAATAVLVDELLKRLEIPLDAEIAECLYTGLSTDTGSFRYSNTTPEVHEFAGRLLATGIRPDVISRRLFDSRPFGALGLFGKVLSRARLESEVPGGLVWTYATREDLKTHGQPYDVLESLIDVVRTAEEAEVACVFKETEDGAWAVSLRSRGEVDVSRIAVELGGGGHRFAAGFTFTGGLDDALGRIRTLLSL